MEEHDLLLIVDATVSMRNYLAALNTSLPQIISISALTGCFARVGIIAYRDYSEFHNCIGFSGWLDTTPEEGVEQPDLVAFAKQLKAQGGGDYPEAAKTALATAYDEMRADAKTVILLYTDAPPHSVLPIVDERTNAYAEERALLRPLLYGSFGSSFVDWVSTAKTLARGKKQAQVFALLEWDMPLEYASWYTYLCEMTGGACIHLDDSWPDTISKASIELLLLWMGLGKGGDEARIPGDWSYYRSTQNMWDLEDETDPLTNMFFPVPYNTKTPVLDNVTQVALIRDVMVNALPKKASPAQSPSERWDSDPAYQGMATMHLMRVIKEDVCAIAINPVFGSLWRAICKDRTYIKRDGLVDAFSRAVGDITDGAKQKVMQNWLDESYNFSAEIQAAIDSVEAADRFPCVFLDPTIRFDKLSRAELLEISRSCHPLILRRLGSVLTQLTYVDSANEMPMHIANANTQQARTIPLAMASGKYGSQFWEILLHTINPGTQLATRPAALLAALTIRMGISFLGGVANNVEVPETWAVGCMALLLDANKACQHSPRLLKYSDALVFESLTAFKTLEQNLDTPLTARIPWTPVNAVYPIGPLVVCQSCQYPRSVTIMGPNKQCGVCLVDIGVSHDVTPSANATWVECSVPSCRGQYVVYDVEGRRVRPKCHYCRQQGSVNRKDCITPLVECSNCTSRIIWPTEYRPQGFDESAFTCAACQDGRETIVEVQVTPRTLAVENSTSWLAIDSDNPGISPFTNCTPYHTVSTIGPIEFVRRISLFPARTTPLTQREKPILNTPDLISTLKDLVAGRKAPRLNCSLCFDTFHPRLIVPACGRKGCLQRICTTCAASWYGSNAAGRIINTAALACPFCRRRPSPRTLSKYGNGIHAVRDLNQAVEHGGRWIYAWCAACLTAKEFVERDCARGAPPELSGWICGPCEEAQREYDDDDDEEGNQREIKRGGVMRPCPKCGVMTEKIAGCGHITCPVDGCGAEWCYFCGEEVPEGIYDHMGDVHGGIYDVYRLTPGRLNERAGSMAKDLVKGRATPPL
ncbi:hypothetical protein BDV18DRAFT_154698 [Aspergillus unguis]